MFGINFLNPFSGGRYIRTTTILWLQIFVAAILVIAGVILYSYSSTGAGVGAGTGAESGVGSGGWGWGTIFKVLAYILIGVAIALIITYLLIGYYIIPRVPDTCSYCPDTPAAVRMVPQGPSVLPMRATLPTVDPYTATHLYYILIQDLRGPGQGVGDGRTTIINRKDHFRMAIDRMTGELQFIPSTSSNPQPGASFSQSTNVGKIPEQNLVQIAVIQNQKTYVIYINGERRASISTSALPPTTSLSSDVIFNETGIINSGLLYHSEIHTSTFSTEDLQRHREAMTAKYTNDAVYQATPLPTNNGSQGFLSNFIGVMRIIANFFGYSKTVETGVHAVKSANS
jgi:preprotein translocase subunit SecG